MILIDYIKAKFANKIIYRQEELLELALKERGYNITDFKIEIDHINGINYIDKNSFSLIYPDSFFEKTRELWLDIDERNIDFYFNGNMNASGKRSIIIDYFNRFKNSIIIDSDTGRKNKSDYNLSYYKLFVRSVYGLCPHQSNWPGDPKTKWTYRFIESLMSGAIPVLFTEADLGDNFIKGFVFKWDTEFINVNSFDKPSKVDQINNYKLALERFTLPSAKFPKLY